jgi:hypothetical protein
LSGEHFSVDGSLIDAWASMKSCQPSAARNGGTDDDDQGADGSASEQGRNPSRNSCGERRSNKTRA